MVGANFAAPASRWHVRRHPTAGFLGWMPSLACQGATDRAGACRPRRRASALSQARSQGRAPGCGNAPLGGLLIEQYTDFGVLLDHGRPRAAPRGRRRVMSIRCFTQWLATSLGVLSPKSSPSFELSKVRSQVDKKLDRYFNHISVLRCIRPQFIVREWKPPCSHEITVLAPLRTSDDTSCNKEVRREAALYLIEDSPRGQ